MANAFLSTAVFITTVTLQFSAYGNCLTCLTTEQYIVRYYARQHMVKLLASFVFQRNQPLFSSHCLRRRWSFLEGPLCFHKRTLLVWRLVGCVLSLRLWRRGGRQDNRVSGWHTGASSASALSPVRPEFDSRSRHMKWYSVSRSDNWVSTKYSDSISVHGKTWEMTRYVLRGRCLVRFCNKYFNHCKTNIV